MAAIKVLIVDDQTLIRDGLSSLLSIRPEIDVVGTAGNGRDAVIESAELEPDVILMDIRMPVMDGITALKKIKDRNPGVRVIMLTTFDDEEYVVKSLKAGAEGYLLKDIPTDDLVRALQQVYRGTFQAAGAVISRLAAIINEGAPGGEAGVPELEELRGCYNELSDREKAIFQDLGSGMTNREIAYHLNLTEGTVKNYMTNILAGFDMRDRTQLALLAYKLGYGS
ncbi:MAG: response regulator transcription factor [Spirochaetales bacterium]|uniref:Response regulator transcription factor n=1 Tax=Candidatus Thalassospirochaeta sargassi TaxID=3119039 RepID=A0AAJ1IK30_9SPIO|nr:response regulator transcription factor [Spirochaetales bacterium]